MTAQEAFLLAIAYTKKVIEGGGALKGAACQIKSITAITGGHRITFEWEDNAGNVETDTMDVMDGTDGAAGVGISTIAYKEEDAQGNYVYTITLTSGSTYDITCPKGPQGATGATGADGADGQDGADGVGITSITKTGTSGLVDTYTITYTNGTTSNFTVTNGQDGGSNEFIGTLEQWEALSPAQRKEYDTYLITNDYSAGSGLPNYSTTEQLTGQKWIDGKDIYFKVYHVDNLANNTNVTLEQGFGATKNAIRFDGNINVESGGSQYRFTATHYASETDCAYVCVNGNDLIVHVRDNYSAYSGDFVVYYTKNA